MGKKSLIIENPIISNVPQDNFIFTVLNNNKLVLNTFVLHNYIDALSIYDEGSHDFSFRFRDTINCFVLKKYFLFSFIHREIIELDSNNVINFIKKLIDLNFYILVNIDRFHIKAYNTNKHYSHEIMIFGYDDDLSLFYVKDFFDGNGSLYTASECTFNEISMAFNSYSEFNLKPNYDGLLALKLNPSPDFSIDYLEIKSKISNYINAVFYGDAKRNYGISIFDAVEYQLKDEKNHGAPVKFLIAKFNFIKASMILMKMRIDFFNQFDDYKLNDEQHCLKNLIQHMESLTNVCLKMLMKNKRFSIRENEGFIFKIKEIKKQFQEIISSFLNKLNK